MAKQDSILKFTGNIGDLSFFKTKEGYSVRKRGGVSGDRIRNDASYERTRENMQEFTRAAGASKLLRGALRPLIRNSKDSRMSSRLTKVFLQVIKSDAVSRRGLRKVIEGDTTLLRGFEFNLASPFGSTFTTPYSSTIVRSEGRLEIAIPSFAPANGIEWPEGATHCRLLSSGVELDFDNKSFNLQSFAGDDIARTPELIPEIVITHNLPPASELPLILVFGVEFYQLANGEMYPLKNGAFNSLALIEANGGE